MDELTQLMEICKCEIILTINEHRNYYQTPQEWLSEQDLQDDEIDQVTIDGIVKSDVVVDLQFYPVTPIGFYRIVHYDLSAAIKRALAIMAAEEIRRWGEWQGV